MKEVPSAARQLLSLRLGLWGPWGRWDARGREASSPMKSEGQKSQKPADPWLEDGVAPWRLQGWILALLLTAVCSWESSSPLGGSVSPSAKWEE